MAYVGLGLGVDTYVVKNSVAPKFHLRKPLEQDLEIGTDAEQKHDMETVLDIRSDDDQAQICIWRLKRRLGNFLKLAQNDGIV